VVIGLLVSITTVVEFLMASLVSSEKFMSDVKSSLPEPSDVVPAQVWPQQYNIDQMRGANQGMENQNKD